MGIHCSKQPETTFHQFCEKPLHITFKETQSAEETSSFLHPPSDLCCSLYACPPMPVTMNIMRTCFNISITTKMKRKCAKSETLTFLLRLTIKKVLAIASPDDLRHTGGTSVLLGSTFKKHSVSKLSINITRSNHQLSAKRHICSHTYMQQFLTKNVNHTHTRIQALQHKEDGILLLSVCGHTVPFTEWHKKLDHISQGSAATYLRGGVILNNDTIANLLLSPEVKEVQQVSAIVDEPMQRAASQQMLFDSRGGFSGTSYPMKT